jgi:hypothetical protein
MPHQFAVSMSLRYFDQRNGTRDITDADLDDPANLLLLY